MRISTATILLLIFVIGTSCDNQTTFDSKKWKIEEDLKTYPFRKTMIDDIIKNKKFVGAKVKQIIDSLGEPNQKSQRQMIYSIAVDYGTDIDPIYSKDLVLTVNEDSVVTEVGIIESRK